MDRDTFIVLFILTFLMVYIIYVIKSTNKGNITSKFTEKLVLLSSIFIPIGIYLTYTIFSRQIDELRVAATFRSIDRGWLNVNKTFAEYYDKCPNLIDSLVYDWQINTLGKNTYNINLRKFFKGLSEDEDDWTASNYVSNCVFQSMEDFLTSVAVDETTPDVWISNFLQWTNSDILYNNWVVLRSNYALTSQEFTNYLFEFSSKNRNKIKKSGDVDKLALDIVGSDFFAKIIEKRLSEQD